ncbi:Xaa-Pro peptidase family protein [Pseudooceanicola sp. CBS1P-1]|uniref:M24 family metallopeptidase n=1 Tax=Pseudooceanicola albus TaxID=2692189 RepID=A0A6L7G5R8_9RHOB|nr:MULTISPECIES: Xaa-Pro peptidase family protein [Pseudooceanicola]MBT9386117.1 Xaa-Pro peptidase family protein [Pseudooceanicola endophyticus]MXN19465.1 M24 family metallopeptidase [Pseudooceanicola albus]
MNAHLTRAVPSIERLLGDFEPDFDFAPAMPIPPSEYAERMRKLKREAVLAGLDAVVVHCDSVGWFHAAHAYLRYLCDWMREGVLIVPVDEGKEPVLLSFFTQSVILPPGGEPVGVDRILQIGAVGREYADIPGDSGALTMKALVGILRDLKADSIGFIGDKRSAAFRAGLVAEMPKAKISDQHAILDRMQRNRTVNEIAQFRSAAQLISIATQAAYHVARPGVTDYEIYAAFTMAQMARGGETGDGYQIGANQWGTHCGKPYGHVMRRGDLANLYVSNVTYQGYTAQTARMFAFGDLTDRQELVLDACTRGVKAAEKLIKPGTLVRDLNNAAFESYIEAGMLSDAEARTMPYNWSTAEGGAPREIPRQYVPDADYEAQGRKLMHVYPATFGPHNPNLGHSVGMAGGQNAFNISSHNYDKLEEGMVFVLHTQWLEPQSAGCNIGDMYVVTADGFENLSRHTPLETYRVPA